MPPDPGGRSGGRRRLLRSWPILLPPLGVQIACASLAGPEQRMLTVYTFGDSILDCGHYNAHGVHPGQLLVRNDDRLFPDFKGRDLTSRGPCRLVHCAEDGATVARLAAQRQDVTWQEPGMVLLTVGGNDLIRGLAGDRVAGMRAFESALEKFLVQVPVRPVLVGTVYDPTFGFDDRNFLPVDPKLARANLARMNGILTAMGARFGAVADIHRHFLGGDPSWFTGTIEPSLIGASEVRRVFLTAAGR